MLLTEPRHLVECLQCWVYPCSIGQVAHDEYMEIKTMLDVERERVMQRQRWLSRFPRIHRYPMVENLLKWIAYRSPPPLRELLLPCYPYSIEPAQLACLVNAIDKTQISGGAVCEIGVGWGYTSVFLLEHSLTLANPPPMVFVDTFCGFTRDSIGYEMNHRSKKKKDLIYFRYGSKKIYEAHLKRKGYQGFSVIEQDCQKVDWSAIGPIAVVLLDVDLYLPTKYMLNTLWPLLAPGGCILVDDCLPRHSYDGAYDAYNEFISEHGLPFMRVGTKGGLAQKE